MVINMNILVTGSNGFIGSHVVKWLKNKGCFVIGLDRTADSTSDTDEYVFCDLYTEDTGHIFEKISVGKLDAIVHLAADMRKEPHTIEVIKNNCVGAQRLLELCRDKNIGVFVQLSSLPVIGSPSELPITESHPVKPPTVYHCTKIMQELLANYAFYTYGVRTVSYRKTAPVGPRMNPKTILPVFVQKALAGEDIVLLGKGTRRQTYVHVTDIAQAIYKAVISPNAQGVYNLASHNLISNKRLAELCVVLTGSSSRIVYSGQPDPADDYNWEVSLDKLKRDTGYESAVGIEEMITELKLYYSESDLERT